MRYNEIISEAPIADFQVVGRESEKYYNGFDKSDEGIVKSDKGVQKIMNAFSKTPFVFNVYVVLRPTEGIWGTTIKDVKQDGLVLLTDLLGYEPVTDGRITCVYLTNVTTKSNRMPMNAWTVAHRIIHMLQTSSSGPDLDARRIERVFWQGLIKLASMVLKEPTDIKYYASTVNPVSHEDVMLSTAVSIMTQKSARNNNMPNVLDPPGEALAQYLLSGSVRYKSAQDFVNLMSGFLGGTREDIDMVLLQKTINKAEKAISKACHDTLKEMEGYVFSF